MPKHSARSAGPAPLPPNNRQKEDRAIPLRNSGTEFHDRWYIRYPVGLAILGLIGWFWSAHAVMGRSDIQGLRPWIVESATWLAIAVAAWKMREVSVLVLGAAFVWWLVGDMKTLSVPTAIVLGACIIAYAIYATSEVRRRRSNGDRE